MIRFRAVTYNVHKCQGMDRRVNERRIAGVLADLEADVIALQEVLDHQAEAIAGELGLRYAVGENRRHGGYGYGNVLLTRGRIESSRNYDITVRGREERGCLRADIVLDGAPLLHVFNVHLGTALIERRHQGRRLVAPELLCDPVFTGPRLVMGDFNEWTRGLATRLLCSHLESATPKRARTYPGLLPLLNLDHIYHDPVLCLEHFDWHRTRKTLVASDHLPLVADFEWQAAG
jgi:endonuclease/exonuclease/phosphatase family metal-dependent hydrolase